MLEKLLDDIDAGNSNITEEEGKQIITMLSEITDNKMSKYQACQYLNISRATFDNLVKEGSLPKYLIGYIVMKMYDCFKNYLCQ